MLRAARERYRRDREKARARMRAWYLTNRDRQIERARQWRREHPESHRIQNAARRARLANGRTSGISIDDIRRLPRECAYCGRSDVDLTLDHRMPLSRGGLHEIGNLVWACSSCNSRKSARDELEYRAILALEELVRGRTRIRESDGRFYQGRLSVG